MLQTLRSCKEIGYLQATISPSPVTHPQSAQDDSRQETAPFIPCPCRKCNFQQTQNKVFPSWPCACRGCNPVINYDGARCTARSFADMTKGTRLLLHRLTHPTKMLTLGSNQALLASHAAPSRRSIQGTAAAPSAAGIAGRPCADTLPAWMLKVACKFETIHRSLYNVALLSIR